MIISVGVFYLKVFLSQISDKVRQRKSTIKIEIPIARTLLASRYYKLQRNILNMIYEQYTPFTFLVKRAYTRIHVVTRNNENASTIVRSKITIYAATSPWCNAIDCRTHGRRHKRENL